jgi:lysophospholipase L1-like esterase
VRDRRIIFGQVVALTLLVGPVFAGNESNYRYLALGDSVSFGYDPTVAPLKPANYKGYPEFVAEAEHLVQSKKEVNASCPGQSSLSFQIAGVQDIGCEGFKRDIGLHTSYPDSQLKFAVSELSSNKHINLVTLSIGGDDLLLLQAQCGGPTSPKFADCVEAALPAVLSSYGGNLVQILAAIRSKYHGDLVMVKYYSPSADQLFIKAILALNKVMTDVDTQFNFGVKFADGFTAFQTASAKFGGDPCKAGLLVQVSPTACDVHPTLKGQSLLASTVLSAISGK